MIVFIVYVKNQEKSKEFYNEVLQTEPFLDVVGITEYRLDNEVSLGIMPEDAIYRLLEGKISHPSEINGKPKCEIYIYVKDPDSCYQRLINSGGVALSEGKIRDWGDYVCYGYDLDGNILAFAKRD
ncbi:VOC family protein [bacterium]|nr:VOC family protein [bacterium]